MIQLGFSDVFVNLIMACLSSISYFVLLNGQLVGNIKPSRGLRKSDPLSPCLFLLRAMGLQSLLKKAEVNDDNKVCLFVTMARVSHLFFADDSVLFCRANERECQIFFEILDVYERGLG